MGARYLTDLADVCRRTGYRVIEVGPSRSQTGPQWKTRSRKSGGYDSGLPNHIMVHHTASSSASDGWPDVNFCTFVSTAKPVCNLYLARNGDIYVCAAGATNTNGVGEDPCGAAPDDSMNRHAVAIEGGNNGRGEPWPSAQLDCYVKLCAQLAKAYGIPNNRIHGHAEYAPNRKIDPAGPPKYAQGAATWNMGAFRSDVLGASMPVPSPIPPPPTQDPDEDDMPAAGLFSANNATSTEQKQAVFWWDGKNIGWVRSQHQIDVGRVMGYYVWGSNNAPLMNFSVQHIQMMIDNAWAGGPVPPGFKAPPHVDSGVG